MNAPTRSEVAVSWVVYAPLGVMLAVVVLMGVNDWSFLQDPLTWVFFALLIRIQWMLWKRSKRAS